MIDHANRRLEGQTVPELGRVFREIVLNQNRGDWWRRALRLLQDEKLRRESRSTAPANSAAALQDDKAASEGDCPDRCRHSSYYALVYETRWLAEMHQEALRRGMRLAVFRPDVDDEGVDLLLRCNGIFRAVQEKCTAEGRSNCVGVNRGLQAYPGGCAVMMSEGEEGRLRYAFFGDKQAVDLSSYASKRRTKANAQGFKAERPAVAEVPRTKFTPVRGIYELFDLLFA